MAVVCLIMVLKFKMCFFRKQGTYFLLMRSLYMLTTEIMTLDNACLDVPDLKVTKIIFLKL